MSLTLAQFYAQVSSELRRGSSFDSDIPAKVRQAVRWFEDLHTFLHMEIYVGLQYLTEGLNYVAIPAGFKRMEFWRIEKPNDGGFRYLDLINPRDITRTDTAMPNGYFESADDKFYFDNIPDQTYNTNMKYDAYTVLPTDTSQSPAIIQKYEGVLLAQTCVLMSPRLRDDKFLVTHKSNRDDLMKSAIWADEERRAANMNASVIYGAEFRERVNERN